MESGFDSYAEKYDSWFLDNRNVLYSEAALVAVTKLKCLELSCGSSAGGCCPSDGSAGKIYLSLNCGISS